MGRRRAGLKGAGWVGMGLVAGLASHALPPGLNPARLLPHSPTRSTTKPLSPLPALTPGQVLDTPEFFWSAPDSMQNLYKRVCEVRLGRVVFDGVQACRWVVWCSLLAFLLPLPGAPDLSSHPQRMPRRLGT